MTMQWFRMYSEFATDPKVQSMSETFQRRFVMMLCMQCAGQLEITVKRDETQVKRDIAFQLRISDADVTETLAEFERREMVKGIKIVNWNKRQYKSDVSTARVRKFRKQKGNVSGNVSETPSDSDTEQIQNRTEKNTTAAARPAETPEFSDFKSIYPKRAGSQPWPKALRAIHARLAEGTTWTELLEGARRYAAHIRATGKERTEYVLQAATFCGPDKRFLELYPAPSTRADTRLMANISAADEFMRRTEGSA